MEFRARSILTLEKDGEMKENVKNFGNCVITSLVFKIFKPKDVLGFMNMSSSNRSRTYSGFFSLQTHAIFMMFYLA